MNNKSIEIVLKPSLGEIKINSRDGDRWEDLRIALEGLSFLIIVNSRDQLKAPDEIKKYCFEYIEKAVKTYKIKIEGHRRPF